MQKQDFTRSFHSVESQKSFENGQLKNLASGTCFAWPLKNTVVLKKHDFIWQIASS